MPADKKSKSNKDLLQSPKGTRDFKDDMFYKKQGFYEKAQEIAKTNPNSLIIGSDQVALHGQQMVGKPHTHEVAIEQLKTASGKKIELFTGLALLNSATGTIESDVIPFTVHFKRLSESTIERYLRKEKPYNCAGSVKSEGLGIALFKKFEGQDPSALIGLPLIRLVTMLENQGFDVFAS